MASLSDIMDGLAELAPGDLSQNVYPWSADSITVPCVVVGYPTRVEYDLTFQRGGDTYEIPVWYVVGQTSSKTSRDRLSTALTGVVSVKEALDGNHDFGAVRVTDATVETFVIGELTHIAIRYSCEVLS